MFSEMAIGRIWVIGYLLRKFLPSVEAWRPPISRSSLFSVGLL